MRKLRFACGDESRIGDGSEQSGSPRSLHRGKPWTENKGIPGMLMGKQGMALNSTPFKITQEQKTLNVRIQKYILMGSGWNFLCVTFVLSALISAD